jgi:hypothetical protein
MPLICSYVHVIRCAHAGIIAVYMKENDYHEAGEPLRVFTEQPKYVFTEQPCKV